MSTQPGRAAAGSDGCMHCCAFVPTHWRCASSGNEGNSIAVRWSHGTCSLILCLVLPPSLLPTSLAFSPCYTFNAAREYRAYRIASWIHRHPSSHAFLQANAARRGMDSLRVGFSPDYTLAYVDILMAEGAETAAQYQRWRP